MANRIQIRKDTTANWGAANPILLSGELGLDTSLRKIKIGNGTSTWSALSFYTGEPSQLINGLHTVTLNSTGGVNFPTLSVDIHNGGVQSAQVLKFDNASQQVIITGPTPAEGFSSERIIIQGQRATGNGEGGDVYLWGGDSAINGGDIKIYAGDADSDDINGSIGGYVNIDAGNGFTNGGNLTLSAGVARGGENSYGGNVSITAGYAYNGTPGNIQLITYAQSDSANLAWTFTNDGKLQLPAGGDIVNSDGNSVLGSTDIYKFAGGTIGTKNNSPTSNGWGGYDMYLDPGGESAAYIYMPGNVNQDGGAALQILNKGAATSIVQVTGWGGVQLVTNTGLTEKIFEFGDDGRLTLPADSLIVSETASTISVGAGLAELETTYTDLMLMLDNIFTQISSESGYPWGITLPLSVPLTYDQLIQLPPDTFTGQANATTVAHNANTAYNVWQDAAVSTNIHVNVSNKSWMFGNDGKLTLPSGNAQIVAESNGGVRIGTANTNVAPNAQIRIGGADHVFEIFGGPPSYSWKFDIDGTTSFPNNSIKNSLDSNTAITTQRTLTANNSYTNVTDFSTDVDLGVGIGVIAGWYQRTLTQIEFSLFGDSTFQSYLTGLALGRTVIVTYNTSGGTTTLTGTLTQAFSGTGQTDPNNPSWSRVSGRIDATLPVGQLGIVSINFPVYSTSTNNWTFGTDGKLTLPSDGNIKNGVDIPQVGSTTTIANDGSGGLVGWGTNSLSVAYNAAILSTYTAGSTTITFQDGVVATITQIEDYTSYIDISWDTPKTGTLFPITLKTANYVAAYTAPQWTFGTDGRTIFPNGTVPAHSYGAAGDKEGMVVFSDNYIYYCKQDYVSNSVNVTTLASSGLTVYVSSTDYAGDLVADFTANSTGWTYAGVSIISVAVDNTFGPGYALEAATSFGAINSYDYALVSPITTDIWKRVSWSVDTW